VKRQTLVNVAIAALLGTGLALVFTRPWRSPPTASARVGQGGAVGQQVSASAANGNVAAAVTSPFAIDPAKQEPILSQFTSKDPFYDNTLGTAAATATPSSTVLVRPTLTLMLSGLADGVLPLGKTLTATGIVTSASLAAGIVTLTVQREQNGKWLAVTALVGAISTSGTYGGTFMPVRYGTYRIKTTLAATATNTAATTMWLPFEVK
jgi:hypothetical protein